MRLNAERRRALGSLAVAAVVGLILVAAAQQLAHHAGKYAGGAPATATGAHAQYVGAAACAACHAREYAAWRGSQHQQAMQHAAAGTVLGDFANAKFSYAGVASTFYSRDGAYYVNTDGPDGRLHDYKILYTFGINPLQQYLIAMPGGRLQALSIAWDTRPREQGGQRWFHLYPGQAIRAGDRLHWTGIDQNWNFQCADCHSTHLQKRFDGKANVFNTTWSEINVACEACHGAGSQHRDWARHQGDWRQVANKGFENVLDERHGASWSRAAGATTATRSTTRATSREIDTCASCHARRGQFADDRGPGRGFADDYRPALLEEGLYWPDGQMRGEVYNYGSFLQSRMYAMGVTCGDCHDPHTLQLRAPGNLVCAQCHDAVKYDAPGHSHHASGTPGAQCAACHMPTTTYMQVDARHDHSLRIPRPDRTIALGVPNACNQCHRNRDAAWAAARIRSWTPLPTPGHQGFAEALYAAERSASGAADLLRAVVSDPQQPAIARASAVALLSRYPGPASGDLLHAALRDASPLVRGAAVEALSGEPPEQRSRWLLPLADDPVRAVRIEVAQALAGITLTEASAAERDALARATADYLAAQQFNADRPEAHGNLGLYYARIGQQQQAQAEFERALAIDPGFVPAAVNLADLYRARGEETRAESVLRSALPASHDDASLHYALGLSLARQQRLTDALAQLQQAARLAPGDPRYAYVYGVALHSAGRQAEGIAVLAAAHARFTGDPAILQALATMERDRGRMAAARAYAQELVQLTPDDPQAHALLRQLGP